MSDADFKAWAERSHVQQMGGLGSALHSAQVGALEQQLSDLKRTYESTVSRLQEQLSLVRSTPGSSGGGGRLLAG